MTPMLVVIVALGTTDLLFALDSIPAIYGLTKEPYLVFAANVFALMGLRQLYFLIGGLLERLIYLSLGLSFVLGFIGVKLILEALHENELPFINGGEPVTVVEISTPVSLGVIVGVLLVTVVASLLSPRGRAQQAVSSLRHLAENYLDIGYEEDEAVRAAGYQRLTEEEHRVKALPEKYRRYIREEQKLLDLLARAHAVHDERVRDAG